MEKPIFKNVHLEKVQILSTPRGISVTVRPGKYVQGEWFRNLVKPGDLEEISEEEAKTVLPKDIDFSC